MMTSELENFERLCDITVLPQPKAPGIHVVPPCTQLGEGGEGREGEGVGERGERGERGVRGGEGKEGGEGKKWRTHQITHTCTLYI